MTPAFLRCPVCAEPAEPSHTSCEACGAVLRQPAASRGRWLSSASSRVCAGCGRPDAQAPSHCVHCGKRRTVTSDRAELDLGTLGAATDFGRRHAYNQDALAVGRVDSTSAAVVCDGVSSADHAELAALAASETGVAELLDCLFRGHSAQSASQSAVAAAAQAAAKAGAGMEDNPPGCTYVSAVVDSHEITVTWVGDSRAYWVTEDSAQCLTVDDSHAARLAALHVPHDDPRYHTSYAHALIAWLGADAPQLQPNSTVIAPQRPGVLVVCSDGLSGYTSQPEDLLPLPSGKPARVASQLTAWARDQGGRDNISVAVAQFPPAAQPQPEQ